MEYSTFCRPWSCQQTPFPLIAVMGITGSGKAAFLSSLLEKREIETRPDYDTNASKWNLLGEDELAEERAVSEVPSQVLYHKRRECSRWGQNVEPDQPWQWTKLLLNPTATCFQDRPEELPEGLNSEQIAKQFLRALYDSAFWISKGLTPDVDRTEQEMAVFHRLGPIWSQHYREAERYSHTLPAMLDNCLQKWAQGTIDEQGDLGVDLNTQTLRSPLHFCSALGFERLGEVYLQMGADPNVLAFPSGQSALHLACAGGHTGMMELLLDRDADIEKCTTLSERTPLHLSAFGGYAEAVKLLLAEGADVHAKDKWGYTALALATVNGHEGVAKLLRVFDNSDLAHYGGWMKEWAYTQARGDLPHPAPNHGNVPDRTSSLFKCRDGEGCGSQSSNGHNDLLRHVQEEHPAQGASPNDQGHHQRQIRPCQQCYELKCHLCDEQTRCLDYGDPVGSHEVDGGWIAVDRQKCGHCTWRSSDCRDKKGAHSIVQDRDLGQ